MIERLNREWNFFGKDEGKNDKFVDGKRKETVVPYRDRVGDYWLSIPTAQYNSLVAKYAKSYGKLDGSIDIAWSAAFISYCMQAAGAGKQFPYDSGHQNWMKLSIKNRLADKLSAPLVGYRVDEFPLEVGDLIGAPREEFKNLTYDQIPTAGWFKSHSDVIVEINKPKKRAYVIGGNVGQSVSKVEIKIDADGRLADTQRNWVVHIRNNIKTSDVPVALTAEAKAGAMVG
ncbi:DUF2272 domain-containing protein [Bosea sp. Tri-44]|uniref:DUF2272 domain-containing protein n=1 Tax=Bosea sp. Tri-44 TaxID=1972137 RepID=UPI0013E92A7F|nr:DUF2272 domain-containing protein [Bosea sp. Tri-44]